MARDEARHGKAFCSRRSDKFALSQLSSHNIGSIIGVAISSVNLVSLTSFYKKRACIS